MSIEYTDNDVLLGRGYAIMSHPGNVRLRARVASRKPDFLAAPRAHKRAIARSVVEDIQANGGRFLTEDPSSEKRPFFLEDRTWMVAEEERAVEKVMHQLREKEAGPKGGKGKEGSEKSGDDTRGDPKQSSSAAWGDARGAEAPSPGNLTSAICGTVDEHPQVLSNEARAPVGDTDIPVSDLLKAVVIVGIYSEKDQRIVRAGSGFFVDKKRGFIVTAGHTLMDRETWREVKGKIVVGVVPSNSSRSDPIAAWRYFARIIAKDPSIDDGVCTLDACVLQITTRMENDVMESGKEIGEQPETLLMNSPVAMKSQSFTQLNVSQKFALDEAVRILGFNQGGEGLIAPGEDINRCADVARGHVVMKFAVVPEQTPNRKFQPRSEIVVICPKIGGHSGGPCVNQQGEVIGILSRADPANRQRCYLVPSSEWLPLVKAAKNELDVGAHGNTMTRRSSSGGSWNFGTSGDLSRASSASGQLGSPEGPSPAMEQGTADASPPFVPQAYPTAMRQNVSPEISGNPFLGQEVPNAIIGYAHQHNPHHQWAPALNARFAASPNAAAFAHNPNLHESVGRLSPSAIQAALARAGTSGATNGVPAGGVVGKGVPFFLEASTLGAGGFPMTLEALVDSGMLSKGRVVLPDEAQNTAVRGGVDRVENAVRVSLVLARLLGSCRSAIDFRKSMGLGAFVVGVDSAADEAGSRVRLWMDIAASATGGLGPKGQVSEGSVLSALGKLLYSIFVPGASPVVDLTLESEAARPTASDEDDVLERNSKSSRSAEDAAPFSRLVKGGTLPVSVCRLLCDLMDGADAPFESVDDVVGDLELMVALPQTHLFDPDPAPGGAPPVFGHATYGRRDEYAAIANVAIQRMQSPHRPELGFVLEAMFVSGIAGSGKSRLVQAVGDTLAGLPNSPWVVARAKFERGLERASRRIVSSMFDRLISFLVNMKQSEDPSDIAYSLRAMETIATSIGYDRLSSLAEFLPSLSLLFDGLSSSDAGVDDQAEAAQWRLIFSLSKVIEAVLDSDRFVMLSCDDLQWADKPTLTLLSELLVNLGGMKNISGRCLFVGLFRDNEIDDSHPFAVQLAYLQMMTFNVSTTIIKLSSLGKEDISDMLMTELRLPSRYVRELADTVHKRTSGHAFFVVELLNALARDSIIAYSTIKCRYDWDEARIYLLETGQSVAELIASNVSSMPISSQKILRILSCFGIQTDTSLLRLLEGYNQGILSMLDTFVEQGILDRAGPIYIFAHDLIQEQVYKSMPPAERQMLHFGIGKFLGERAGLDATSLAIDPVTKGIDQLQLDGRTFFTGRESMTSSLVAIACDQINAAGPSAIVEDDQRIKFARWNLVAGQQAQHHSNSHGALFYFSSGIAFLGEGCWQKNHEMCLELHEGAVFASFALGEFDTVARYAEEVSQNASFEEALEVQRVVLQSLTHSGKHGQSVSLGVSILRQLHFDIPSEPSPESVMKAVFATDAMASKLSKEQIVHLCEKTVDDSVHRVVKVMDTFYSSCYASSSPFLPLVACIIIQYSLQHGICPEAPVGFATMAMLKIFLMGDYAGGRYWADLVSDVEAKHRSLHKPSLNRESFSSIILFIAVDIWFQSAREVSQRLLAYCDNAMRSGQLHIAIPAIGISCRYKLLGGENLSLLRQTYLDRIKLVAKHSLFVAKYMAVDSLLLAALTGEPCDCCSVFDGSISNMEDIQEVARSSKDMTLLQSSHVFNELIEFWRGNYSAAEEHSHQASTMFPASKEPTIYLIYHVFVRGLIMFRLYRKLHDDERLKSGRETIEEMGKWAHITPKVFENKLLLLKAECHASVGEHDEALHMYERSIEASQDCGNIHELALAYELMGRHFAARNNASDANECFQNAYLHYQQWGATAVAEKLLQEFSFDVSGLDDLKAKRTR